MRPRSLGVSQLIHITDHSLHSCRVQGPVLLTGSINTCKINALIPVPIRQCILSRWRKSSRFQEHSDKTTRRPSLISISLKPCGMNSNVPFKKSTEALASARSSLHTSVVCESHNRGQTWSNAVVYRFVFLNGQRVEEGDDTSSLLYSESFVLSFEKQKTCLLQNLVESVIS